MFIIYIINLKVKMQVFDNNYKYNEYENFNKLLNQPYNYNKQGLANKILSNKLTSSKNTLLNFIIQYWEKSFIYCMKYVDELKNFKNFNWK